MTNLDSILKSRDITLPAKVGLIKLIFFPVVMYGCVSWTIKKAEQQRIDAFELWCWRRLFRVPWTCKKIQLDGGSEEPESTSVVSPAQGTRESWLRKPASPAVCRTEDLT